jgi:predicted DNA-binding protein
MARKKTKTEADYEAAFGFDMSIELAQKIQSAAKRVGMSDADYVRHAVELRAQLDIPTPKHAA